MSAQITETMTFTQIIAILTTYLNYLSFSQLFSLILLVMYKAKELGLIHVNAFYFMYIIHDHPK